MKQVSVASTCTMLCNCSNKGKTCFMGMGEIKECRAPGRSPGDEQMNPVSGFFRGGPEESGAEQGHSR